MFLKKQFAYGFLENDPIQQNTENIVEIII